MTTTPHSSRLGFTFSTPDVTQLDVKHALLEKALGNIVTLPYFEKITNNEERLRVVHYLINEQLGTLEDWKNNYILAYRQKTLRVRPIGTLSFNGITHNYSPEEAWDATFNQMKRQFEILKAEYNQAVNQRLKLNLPIEPPVFKKSFDILFSNADLAKYILLVEPNFPLDMPEIIKQVTQSLKIDKKFYYSRIREFRILSIEDKWQCLLEILYPFSFDESCKFHNSQTQEEQLATINYYKNRMETWRGTPSFDEPSVINFVSETRQALFRQLETDSENFLNLELRKFPKTHPVAIATSNAMPSNKDELSRYFYIQVAPKALLYSLNTEPPTWLQEPFTEATPKPVISTEIPNSLTEQELRIVEHLIKFPSQFHSYDCNNGINGLAQTLNLAAKTVRNYVAAIKRKWGNSCPIRTDKGSAGYFPEN
jgi:hypothetical protein